MNDNTLDTTVDEWRAEMEKLQYLDDPGKTISELAKEYGINKGTVARHVSNLVDKGECIKGANTRIDSSGRRQAVIVYQLKKEKKGK